MTESATQSAVQRQNMQSFLDHAYKSRATDGDLKVYAIKNGHINPWLFEPAHRVILSRFPKLKDFRGTAGNCARLDVQGKIVSVKMMLRWVYDQPLTFGPYANPPFLCGLPEMVDACSELQSLAAEYELIGLEENLRPLIAAEMEASKDPIALIKASRKLEQSKSWKDMHDQFLVKALAVLEAKTTEEKDGEEGSAKRLRTATTEVFAFT